MRGRMLAIGLKVVGAATAVTGAVVAASSTGHELLVFAREWGLPMALVASVLLWFIKSQSKRQADDATREARLLKGFEEQKEALVGLRGDLQRWTAIMLAAGVIAPADVERILALLTTADRLCAVCPLREFPEEERTAIVARARQCRENYQGCIAAPK